MTTPLSQDETGEQLDDILRKHEDNRYAFGEVLNRKYTKEAVLALIEAREQQARIASLEKAKHDVDFAKRWSLDYDEVIANLDEAIRVLQATNKKGDDT